MNVSVVIPIYNAADLIEDSVHKIIRALDSLGLDYEVLLRDDGSTDESREALGRLSQRYSQVRCFSNLSNEGLGSTLIKLFHDAQGRHIVYCDCDLPYGEGIIPVLLSRLEFYDIVVASRYSGVPNGVRFVRKALSRLYYFLCKVLFNIPVMDIGSGSVAMRRQVPDKITLRAQGFDVHAELYIKAAEHGFLIEEIPARAGKDKEGSFCILKHGFRVFIETIRLRLKLHDGVSSRDA